MSVVWGEGRNEAIPTYSDTQKTETLSWKIKPLKINHSEPSPTTVTTAVSYTPLNQQVFSVPWLTLLRKEQAAIYRKLKTVYVNPLLHWKKTIWNSNLKAVVSRYYSRKADWRLYKICQCSFSHYFLYSFKILTTGKLHCFPELWLISQQYFFCLCHPMLSQKNSGRRTLLTACHMSLKTKPF